MKAKKEREVRDVIINYLAEEKRLKELKKIDIHDISFKKIQTNYDVDEFELTLYISCHNKITRNDYYKSIVKELKKRLKEIINEN